MLLPLEIERPPPAKQAHRGDYLPAGDLTTITAVVANRGSGGMKPTAPMAASSTAVDGGGGDDVVAAAVDERRPLDFGGRRRRLWQGRWRSSTAVIAIIVDGGGEGRG